MPFIPHTAEEVEAMLARLGATAIDQLFDEIPAELMAQALRAIPPALSEMAISRLMGERARTDEMRLCFAGAGAYEHHIPAAVWQLVTRGEFYTAYTPYQAEASQGTLQLLYEFQSMMTALTGLDVSNASLYDGATALAEAVLMTVRADRKNRRRVVVPRSVHPLYTAALRAIVGQQGIEVVDVPVDAQQGKATVNSVHGALAAGAAALVIPQPNYFGVLEDADALTGCAHAAGALAIALCNPLSLAVLKAPGEWAGGGADIACGEAQPLGIPLAGGGPYLGYLVCRAALMRQMPGRIVGRTLDADGRPGFALTLQAREQHIRRAKATSNICTNQGLMVTAATIYLALTGGQGLARIASACHANTAALVARASAIPGVECAFSGPRFHEAALRLPAPVAKVLAALARQGIVGGVDLTTTHPEYGEVLLVCATETKTTADLDCFASALAAAIGEARC